MAGSEVLSYSGCLFSKLEGIKARNTGGVKRSLYWHKVKVKSAWRVKQWDLETGSLLKL
jgi:hypothetical protein